MKFNINNTEWQIKTVNEDVMNNEMKNDTTLGVTIYKTQEILLLENQANIIKTLKHKLTHVWLYEYGHNQQEKEFNCEDVCEIVSSINDFINEVVEKYEENQNICHVENKSWGDLTKEQQEKLLEQISRQKIQRIPY